MSTIPLRIPASAFTWKGRRRSVQGQKSLSSKAYATGGGECWVPRGPPGPSVSIPYLREAINSLDSKMASLMSQRHELESYLERAVRMQSPVLRLPSELLSSIFVLGVLSVGEEDPVMISTLMLVCRYWAEVVLDTPTLWAKISVSPHDSLVKARRRLERSKTCPLDVTITFGPRIEYVSNVTEQIVLAMDLIRPALWRTRSFRLSVPGRPQAQAALSRCQEDAPLLETLSIRIFHSMQDDVYSSQPLPLFNGHTPRLRFCSLTSFNFGWDHRLVSRLRILKLGGYFNKFTPSASTIIGILRECPDLEELALRNMSNVDFESCTTYLDEECDPPPSKIHLRHLTKLSFYYAGIALTRQIMCSIAVPNLQSLEMSYLENVTPVLHLLYTQALTRLPLRHLRIETCLFNEIKFLSLLRRLSSLVTLELIDIEDVSSSLLKSLSSSQPWVCPRLETLVIDGCTTLDWDSMRAFVESRLPTNPRAYTRCHGYPMPISSSASVAAAAYARSKASNQLRIAHPTAHFSPQRLSNIDVTRCTQISKEMVQWLRMYVAVVRCEPAKGIWDDYEPSF